MVASFLKKFFGSANDRFLKKLQPTVEKINSFEKELETLSDADLKARTDWFRARLANGESEDKILPEVFATVREATKRTLGLRQYDVQMLGGMVLHKGMISEMRTGEGKTLVAAAPVYLNALSGKGVHVVTVNDYLARRDAEWMGPIYNFLGLSVGVIAANMEDEERRAAYACDVTHGTNNELGFDYLRDNMKFRLKDMVQRSFHYAIVDEVDNILIDEARTPLIISGPSEKSSDMYVVANEIIKHVVNEDFEVDEKAHTVTLTEKGQRHIEELVQGRGLMKGDNLYDVHNISIVHHIDQALRAHKLYKKDKEYIVKDGDVIIIDEFTGRMAEGRRYSDGLHQAIEAKENVKIQLENQTLASITYQNYFRLYPKLAGMTGTALTEAAEFGEIYKLEVITIPTQKAVQRVDHDDEVYRTAREKYQAIIAQIRVAHGRKQPVLVGTTSIEKSEFLSDLLKREGLPHQVLNARFHEKEAEIVAQAGKPEAITIATNMAGRGTDIRLGGNGEMELKQILKGEESEGEIQKLKDKIAEEIKTNEAMVREAGGLLIIGTERHESRRIDNQLRGRSGRQGDPGASKFYLSLEDDLMRIFGSQRLDATLQRLGLKEGEAITHPWVSKALARAQQRVEARHFEIRKQLLKYDDVMNDQRKVIYEQRREIMESEDIHETIEAMREDTIRTIVQNHIPPKTYAHDWDIEGLTKEIKHVFNLDLPMTEWANEEGVGETEIIERLQKAVHDMMTAKEEKFGSEAMRQMERSVLLRVLDQSWKEHLLGLDYVRQGIHLRAYGQRDPLNEYKQEAFGLFQSMLNHIQTTVTQLLCLFTIDESLAGHLDEDEFIENEQVEGTATQVDAESYLSGEAAKSAAKNQKVVEDYIPRNSPCPCGSGKRYKHCCGR